MASLISSLSKFARSPAGRRALSKAQTLAKDPKTRQQVMDARAKLAARGGKRPPG
jgi:hypothetical protein